MQDYPKLDKFKDALKQAAQTLTTIRVVFADATANSGVVFSLLHPLPLLSAFYTMHHLML